MRNLLKGGAAAALIIGLGACASNGPEVVEEAAPVVERVAETVPERRAERPREVAPTPSGPVGPLERIFLGFQIDACIRAGLF